MKLQLKKISALAAVLFQIFPIGVQGKEFLISTKSFIQPVQFAGIHTIEAGILAAITNANFSENPSSMSPDSNDYRLWSSVKLEIECQEDLISEAKILREVSMKTGREAFILDAVGEIEKPLKLFNHAPDDTQAIRRFEYLIKGRPNAITLASFYVHDYRSCSWIWHGVSGNITCSQGAPIIESNLVGSGFPSHRLWINDKQIADLKQGYFEKLWSCDENDPSKVK